MATSKKTVSGKKTIAKKSSKPSPKKPVKKSLASKSIPSKTSPGLNSSTNAQKINSGGVKLKKSVGISTEKKFKTEQKEAGTKTVSLIAFVSLFIIIIGLIVWSFAVPEKFRLVNMVADPRADRLFIRASKLEADKKFEVAVIESCNLAVRFDKEKFQPSFQIAQGANLGPYKKPLNQIFDANNITIYELNLSEKAGENQSAVIFACLEGNREKKTMGEDLNLIIDSLVETVGDNIEVVENRVENITIFNQPSKRFFGGNYFRQIKIKPQPNQNLEIRNSFYALDNKILLVAEQNKPEGIEAQVNSLNPSQPSFDTSTATQEYLNLSNQLETKLQQEAKEMNLYGRDNFEVEMEISNFGKLVFELNKKVAPRTVENFLRLVHRKSFDNSLIHRIVKENNFKVIQGGDYEKGDGSGGKSAFFINNLNQGLIRDELWLEEPVYKNDESGKNYLENEPKLRYEEIYGDYDQQAGTIVFPKGTIAMAKSQAPDSAASQFFIMLDDTILPANYTIFGKLKDTESFGVLDKILNQVNPIINPTVEGQENIRQDGKPNQELKITAVRILD